MPSSQNSMDTKKQDIRSVILSYLYNSAKNTELHINAFMFLTKSSRKGWRGGTEVTF